MKIRKFQEKLNNLIDEVVEQEGNLPLDTFDVYKDHRDGLINIKIILKNDDELRGVAVYFEKDVQ